MIARSLLAAVVAATFSAPASAFHCPADVGHRQRSTEVQFAAAQEARGEEAS